MCRQTVKQLYRIVTLVMVVSILSGCALSIVKKGEEASIPAAEFPNKVEELDLVPVVFNVELKRSHSAETELSLDVLDDVTGLDHNVYRYSLQRTSENYYSGTIMLPLGGEVKYRYTSLFPIHQTEASATGSAVIYRMALVNQGTVINDVIAGWPELEYQGDTGIISGIVSDQTTDEPLADVLVSVAGYQTFSDMTGRFYFDNIPTGVHNLVASSIDGSYRTFQQQANVGTDLSTPVVIKMQSLPEVTVTLVVKPPEDAVGAPIRLAGNFYQLGNAFTDLSNGVSTLASRMPLLSRMEDGRYTLQLALHAGNDFRYKYTLGDGFINAERDENGNFTVRRFIVPDHDVTIEDSIVTWRSNQSEPISIQVTVPEETPNGDSISIQFKQDDWFQPIPMWPLGTNQWMMLLYPDSATTEPYYYRICRNDQCELAYDESSFISPVPVNQAEPANNKHVVDSWHMWQPSGEPTAVNTPSGAPIEDKLTGVEFISLYHPSYLGRYREVLQELKQMGINWLILTPTWRVSEVDSLPYLDPNPGKSMLITDLEGIVRLAKENGFSVGLYPQLSFEGTASDWWNSSQKSTLWWQQWYVEYERFLMNYAQFAQKYEVDQLILGSADVAASLPGALTTTATSSGTPKNAEKLWTDLLDNLKQYYQGSLLWGLPLESGEIAEYSFYTSTDGFYFELQSDPSEYAYYTQTTVSQYLESTVYTFQDQYDLPVYFGLNAPSISTLAAACTSADCLINPLDHRYSAADVDLEAQQYFYNTYFPVLTSLDWVKGVSSRGFFPVVKLTDFSSSIYGKPAMDLIWYLSSQ